MSRSNITGYQKRSSSSPVIIDNGEMLKTEPISCIPYSSEESPSSSLSYPLRKVSCANRSCGSMDLGSRNESQLELEAAAAVHELSFAVQSIGVSEMLPRTSDLIFVNLTTLEEQPFCVELTHKGWRITSLRCDCMMGDFTRIELFTKYYDSLHLLMYAVSPAYRLRFDERVSQGFSIIEQGDGSNIGSFDSYVSSKSQDGSLGSTLGSKNITFYGFE